MGKPERKRPHGIHSHGWSDNTEMDLNPLNAGLNPICHLLALLRAHHIIHVSRIRFK